MATTTAQRTVTSADGTEIAYERIGSGPPLVLVHGATVDRSTWADALPNLEPHVTVYAMDRRGRGDSGDAESYAIEREVEDVLAVVESIDDPVTVLGHSFGGLVALEAARHTDHVDRLILYEPGITHESTPDEDRALEEMRSTIEAGEREDALLIFYREIVGLTEAEIDHIRSQPTWQNRVDAVHTAFREIAAGYDYTFDLDRVSDLTVPVLALVGEDSPPEEHQDAEHLREALPDCQVAVLERQQHVAYRMAPEQFAEVVVAFVNGES